MSGAAPPEMAVQQILRQVRQRADVGAAVPPMAFVQFFRLEMAAVRGFYYIAAQPFFHRGLGLLTSSLVLCYPRLLNKYRVWKSSRRTPHRTWRHIV